MPDPLLFLPEGEVHLWYFQTNQFWDYGEKDALLYLDAAESQRYYRYISKAKQQQFLLGRVLLKQLLSNYLEVAADDICFYYSEQQKPYLAGDLAFNMSHSGEHLLIAISRHAIGADIQVEEDIRLSHVYQGLTDQEQQKISTNDLYSYWVLKEAFWKADNQQTDPTFLLEAFHKSPRQSTSFCMGQWYATYLRPSHKLHLAWVVAHPRPVCKLNNKLMDLNTANHLDDFTRLQEIIS